MTDTKQRIACGLLYIIKGKLGTGPLPDFARIVLLPIKYYMYMLLRSVN